MIAMPNKVAKPDARGDVEVHVAEIQGHGSAGKSEGDRQQQDHRRPERPVGQDQDQENDPDRGGIRTMKCL